MQGAGTAGRSGTAYSLLTREELPYLLDLHLFLSRPVQAAPELPLDAAAAAAERPDSGASVYGTFPQVGAWLWSRLCLWRLPLGDLLVQHCVLCWPLGIVHQPCILSSSLDVGNVLGEVQKLPVFSVLGSLLSAGLMQQIKLSKIRYSIRYCQTTWQSRDSHGSMDLHVTPKLCQSACAGKKDMRRRR